MTVTGVYIDVSHWQGTIDFAAMKPWVDGIWCKASQGRSTTDPAFATYLAGAHEHGVPVGAYHYASPDSDVGDAIAEADWFCSRWEGRCDLRPMLDLESSALAANLTDDWALAFLARVKVRTGAEPIIYAGPSWASVHLEPNPMLALYDLWVAHYTAKPQPDLPKPWGHWLLWQYTSSGRVPGIGTAVDVDRLSGTHTDLLITQEEDMTPEQEAKLDACVTALKRLLNNDWDEAAPFAAQVKAACSEAIHDSGGGTTGSLHVEGTLNVG